MVEIRPLTPIVALQTALIRHFNGPSPASPPLWILDRYLADCDRRGANILELADQAAEEIWGWVENGNLLPTGRPAWMALGICTVMGEPGKRRQAEVREQKAERVTQPVQGPRRAVSGNLYGGYRCQA